MLLEKCICPHCQSEILASETTDNTICPVCFLETDFVLSVVDTGGNDIHTLVSAIKIQKIGFKPDIAPQYTIAHVSSPLTNIVKISNWGFIDN